MLRNGRDVAKYFTPDGLVYEYNEEDETALCVTPASVVVLGGSCITALTLDCCTSMYKPVATSVHEKLAVAGCDDEDFMDLIDWLLTLDPQERYGLWGAVCMLLCTL